MSRQDEQDKRISKIVGRDEDATFEDGLDKFYEHLTRSLKLPCDVTGVEDFRWEEYYVLGPGSPKEYERLRKTQPSFQDKFELLRIGKDGQSQWMMFFEDLTAHVRRKIDGKEFILGLAEIKAVDRKSANYQLLDDYAVWFVNNR
jgi:hypothetical protein